MSVGLCSGPKTGLHQCPCVDQAYRTTFTVTWKGAFFAVKKRRAPIRVKRFSLR